MTTPSLPLQPFTPHWARVVAVVLAAMVVAATVTLFIVVRPNAATTLRVDDYLIVIIFAAALLGILWRQGTVRAVPDTEGLVVRNLLSTTRVEWAQIVSVRFSSDRAWAQLDLSDGDNLAVMAIQSADGQRARAEAVRLAGLVARFGTPEVND